MAKATSPTFLLCSWFLGSYATALAASSPPAFLLAGDSTTATDGGWGDAFLNTTLANGAIGTNYGHSGATTNSFIAGGDWDNVLSAIADAKGSYSPYVTIQFGHNDQKSEDDMDDFVPNLEKFVKEARDAGATPLILTSLSRRNYDTSVDPPVVKDDLANVREGAIEAAKTVDSDWADLNVRSREYLNAIGSENADTYNYEEDDHTHLNEGGAIVFGGLVAELVLETFPDLSDYVQVGGNLGDALDSGEYYWPS